MSTWYLCPWRALFLTELFLCANYETFVRAPRFVASQEPLEEDKVGVPKISNHRCILLNDSLFEKP
jgi:hypothetical protein